MTVIPQTQNVKGRKEIFVILYKPRFTTKEPFTASCSSCQLYAQQVGLKAAIWYMRIRAHGINTKAFTTNNPSKD